MKPKPKPRDNASADDEALAAMCRWLKAHKLVGLGTRSGRLILIPAVEAYGQAQNPTSPLLPALPRREQNDI